MLCSFPFGKLVWFVPRMYRSWGDQLSVWCTWTLGKKQRIAVLMTQCVCMCVSLCCGYLPQWSSAVYESVKSAVSAVSCHLPHSCFLWQVAGCCRWHQGPSAGGPPTSQAHHWNDCQESKEFTVTRVEKSSDGGSSRAATSHRHPPTPRRAGLKIF